jgi:ribonuclease J
MSLKLTFFDGVNCIGGNKILLEEDDYALILDFGINFNEENKYFDEFLRPRSYFGIYDLYNLNLIPPLGGIYREDLIIPENLENFKNHPWYREINPIATLISHAHLDHVGYLSYLHEDIPIITSLISSLIMKSLEDTSRMISDLCLVRRKAQENGVLKTERNKFIKRPYITFGNGSISKIEEFWNKLERKDKKNIDIVDKPINIIDYETYKIGPFEIIAFPVDHSIPGAVSFAIKTKIGWVVYTGDLRLHGRNKDHSENFIEKLKEMSIKVLICEGTHPKVDRLYTEEDVKENIYNIVKNLKGYIIADFGARNIDRLMSFLEIAKKVGKRLVLTLKDIYLLEALSLVGYPDPKEDENITFYKKPKGSYETWEENLLDRYDIQGKGISAKEIRNSPDDFILCMSYYDFHILLDILPNGGTYIFSSSEAFNEEMKIDQKKIENWLNYFHIEIRGNLVEKREESPFHASGHIHGDGIIKLIDYARPEYLIPVHTEREKNIDFFDQFKDSCKVIYPKKGETIIIT